MIEHGGGIFGFSAYALRLPEERIYVAVLGNRDSPVTDPGYVAKKLAALAAGDPFPESVPITVGWSGTRAVGTGRPEKEEVGPQGTAV